MPVVMVFTATRAEYGLLKPVMHGLREREGFGLQVLVSGTHLSPAHGMTVREIEADGFTIDARVAIVLDDDSSQGTCSAMGLGIIGYGQELARLKPDVVVILGDRFEALAMASACLAHRIPVAHVHGGEATLGAMDEAVRHAVTKMSLLHFTSTEAYRRRVIQLGESPGRVFNVGALGVQNIHTLDLLDRDRTYAELGLDASRPYVMVTYHPVTLLPGSAEREMGMLLDALDGLDEDIQIVFTGANADPEGGTINRLIGGYAAKRSARVRVFASLGQLRYLSAVRHCRAVIGNSSSGIIEAPSLGVPTLDVGDRQAGRIGGPSVRHCAPELEAISDGLRAVLAEDAFTEAGKRINPYDREGTSDSILKVLATADLKGALAKPFHDLETDRPDDFGA